MRLDRAIITAFLFLVVWPLYMGGRMLWFRITR